MNQDFLHTVEQAARSVRKRYRGEIRNAVILGSGLGEAAGGASSENGMVSIPFSDIKGFPGVRVEGHAGILKISAGTAFLLGRFHFYEGHTMQQVMLPVFVLHKLGVKRLIITNAAGSLRKDLKPGTIVLIRDHLNIFGISPFKGLELGSLGPRFISMENAYSACLAGVVGRLCPRGLVVGVDQVDLPAEVAHGSAGGECMCSRPVPSTRHPWKQRCCESWGVIWWECPPSRR